MYLFFGIFFLILLFFFILNFCRRKKIIKKVCSMTPKEKCETLNGLLGPFGYAYVPSQDVITSRIDAGRESSVIMPSLTRPLPTQAW